MPDLHEELQRLADAVGQPVTFRELEVTRHRRERRRRTEALIVGIAVVVLAALILAAGLRQPQTTTPGGQSTSYAPPSIHAGPSGSGVSSIAGFCDERLGPPLMVVEKRSSSPDGNYFIGCPVWPAEKAFTITFQTVPPMQAELELFAAVDCLSGRCIHDPVWVGRADAMSRTFRLPPLAPGQYVLIDPHRAQMVIVAR